jgi:hypothetical protein
VSDGVSILPVSLLRLLPIVSYNVALSLQLNFLGIFLRFASLILRSPFPCRSRTNRNSCKQLCIYAPNNMCDRCGGLTEGRINREKPIVRYLGDIFYSHSSSGSPDLQTSEAISRRNVRTTGL